MSRLLLFLSLTLSFFVVRAQGIYTIGYATYGGVNNLDITPVSAGSTFRSDVNLLAFSAYQAMNGGQYNSLISDRNGLDDVWMVLDEKPQVIKGPVSFDERFDIAGPSFILSPGKMGRARRTIGWVTGVHSWMQVRNFNADVFQWNDVSLDSQRFVLQSNVNMKDVAIRRALWAEYGLNYSEVVLNRKQHELALGATIKVFQGLNGFVVNMKDVTASIDNTLPFDSVQFNLAAKQGFIYHSPNESLSQLNTGKILTTSNGYSLGGDIGFTYSFKPNYEQFMYPMDDTIFCDQTRANYLLRFGVSIKNFGSLIYNNALLSGGGRPAAFRDLNYTYRDSFSKFSQSADATWDEVLRSDEWADSISVPTEQGPSVFQLGLPTTLNLFLDANIYKGFGVSAQSVIAIGNPDDAMTMRLPNVYQVVPKFETAKRGVYVPITYNEWSQFLAGVAVRLGSFSMAISNVNIFNTSAPYSNIQLSMGLRVPLQHKRHADQDNDKISDDLDDCPTQPGPTSAKGCPDADFDGIRDDEDKCQDEAGLREMSGCPDEDHDGITDKEDACPEHFGPEQGTPKRGCPDADEDGFVENGVDDKCPGLKGHMDGCPDSDNDGVMDNEDKCLERAGKPELMGKDLKCGCPDSDGDGLYDFEDDCEEEYGSSENSGCPIYDYDEDGVYDYKDRCQTIPGVEENAGCPTDEVITIQIMESIVYFNEGSELTPVAIAELKNVAADLAYELKEDPRIIIELEGHAGLNETNTDKMALSMSRAEAVKNYLMKEAAIADYSLRISGKADREEVKVKVHPTGQFPDRRVEILLGIPEDK